METFIQLTKNEKFLAKSFCYRPKKEDAIVWKILSVGEEIRYIDGESKEERADLLLGHLKR